MKKIISFKIGEKFLFGDVYTVLNSYDLQSGFLRAIDQNGIIVCFCDENEKFKLIK